MDVEKLKKMNQLAALLRQNHLVDDRMQAASMAGALAGEGKEIQDMFLITPDQKMMLKEDYEHSHGHHAAASPPASQKPALTEERIMEILQLFANQFVAEVNKLEAKIVEQSKLLQELKDIKENTSLQSAPVQHTTQVSAPQQPISAHTAAAQPAASVAPTEVPSSAQMAHIHNDAVKQGEHPRSGSYKPEDVAIDKIFYFGTGSK